MAIEAIRTGEDERAVRDRIEQIIEAVNSLIGSSGSDNISVAAITTAGGTEIEAGTLQEVLQAIADLADPEV